MLVPSTRTQLGRWSFHVAAPAVWNVLPSHLCSPSISRGQFRAGLKIHLFTQAYGHLWELLLKRVFFSFTFTVESGNSCLWCHRNILCVLGHRAPTHHAVSYTLNDTTCNLSKNSVHGQFLWHSWLGDKSIRTAESCLLVCWWWFDWSFAHLVAPILTISIILSSNKIQNGNSGIG